MKENYAKLYTELHRNEKAFAGYSIKNYVDDIAGLVEWTSAKRILDYGSGKGYQYLKRRLHEAWGILPHCYDVGVRQLQERPEGKFDGIICTDVMEHIAESDIDWVLNDIFSFVEPRVSSDKFAFFAIACRPAAKKMLPDGRNVHLTVKPPSWWQEKLDKHKCVGLTIEARFDGDGT